MRYSGRCGIHSKSLAYGSWVSSDMAKKCKLTEVARLTALSPDSADSPPVACAESKSDRGGRLLASREVENIGYASNLSGSELGGSNMGGSNLGGSNSAFSTFHFLEMRPFSCRVMEMNSTEREEGYSSGGRFDRQVVHGMTTSDGHRSLAARTK